MSSSHNSDGHPDKVALKAALRSFLDARVSLEGEMPNVEAARWSENNVGAHPDSVTRIEEFPAVQIFADPLQGQGAAIGVARVAEQLRPYAARVAFAGDQIAEVEEIISTATHGHFADVDRLLLPDVLYEGQIPPERAGDRDAVRNRADSYWQALEESDGTVARFAYRCDRYDNGKKITNNLSILLSPDAAVHSPASCVSATRPARPIARNRRFPVIDTDLGIAVSFVLVDFHPAPHLDRPDCGTFYMAGLFKISDDEIRSLDEIREILPLGISEIWT
ncbi:hypothetical protein [Novosphingobium sp. Leaf2]|uniref:hypothetical protein n=1 Tax=Novosphingobium sp. Leaf2 TaxID=1735670 RepID=UPI00070188BA|nr:hypothetical protein [Novosphingobium sp. Leaf2]KQM20806.1 hypothetical protein ASE49_16020 [Novosphingobium sp. Leaf2]